jgi:hypothetical protein
MPVRCHEIPNIVKSVFRVALTKHVLALHLPLFYRLEALLSATHIACLGHRQLKCKKMLDRDGIIWICPLVSVAQLHHRCLPPEGGNQRKHCIVTLCSSEAATTI